MEQSLISDSIRLFKADDMAAYIPQIDPEEAEELIEEVEENSEEVFAIGLKENEEAEEKEEKIIGFAYIEDDDEGFYYVYIFPEYRHKGYGYAAACAAEKMFQTAPPLTVITAYNSGNAAAKQFAEKCGFRDKFSSAKLIYQGEKFDIPEVPVRQYRDEDFMEAFTLAEEAFHKMRLETGCFPESTTTPPNDKYRQRFAETADERYVYELNGKVVGYAKLDGNELDIICIKISHQGEGLGRNFLKYMINLMIDSGVKEPVLWCVVGNKKARKLYDSLGFKEVRITAYPEKKIEAKPL